MSLATKEQITNHYVNTLNEAFYNKEFGVKSNNQQFIDFYKKGIR